MSKLSRLFCGTFLLSSFYSPVSAQPGSLDLSFDPMGGAPGAIYAQLVLPDQSVVVVGNFTTFAGSTVGRIAKLLPNGALDPTFNAGGNGFNSLVRSLELQPDGKILVGGSFSSYNSTTRIGIARLTQTGSLDLSFNCGTIAQNVQDMVVQPDGKIIAVGNSVNGIDGIVRLTATGAVDPSFDVGLGVNINNTVAASVLALQSDGKVLVGGTMDSFNGVPVGAITRLNTDGSIDPGFLSGTGFGGIFPWLYSIRVRPDGKILVAGQISSYNGTSTGGVCLLNTAGQLDGSFAPNISTSYSTWIQNDGKVVVVGGFTTVAGTPRNRIARLNANGTHDLTFNPGAGLDVNTDLMELTSQYDGSVIVTGIFTAYNGIPRGRIARVYTCEDQLLFADTDGDSYGDPNSTLFDCGIPGYVTNDDDCDDNDPANYPGAPCDDSNVTTGNDVYQSDCTCAGQLIDCLGVAGGTALPGTPCDDGDASTGDDTYQSDCTCAGQLIDCLGVAGGTALPGTVCDDGDASTGNDVYQSDCNCAGQLIDCLGVAGGTALPGTTCDDGDAGTSADVYQADCSCIGVANCTDLQFQLNTGGMGGDVYWEVLDDPMTSTECSGSGYPKLGDCISESCCVPDAMHTFSVQLLNGASDFTGSYILRQGSSGRIVHNGLGFSGSEALHGTDGKFSTPVGTDRLIESRCDANGSTINSNLIATSNPLVAAQVVPGNWSAQTNQAGYEFWIFDPDGGYSHTVYRSLRVSDGGGGGQDQRARTLFLNSPGFAGAPIPLGVELNVRVRHRLPGGILSAYGPACRLIVDGDPTDYWPTHLVDLPGDALHSCGITALFDATSTANRIYTVGLTGGANYRFQWTRITGSPVTVTVERNSGSATNNRFMALTTLNAPSWMPNWPAGVPMPVAGEVWSVRVSAKRFGQSQWSAYGPCCTITIGSSQQLPLDHRTEEASSETFVIWPNPNNGDQVHLAFNEALGSLGQVNIDLYDATGKLTLNRSIWFAEGETDRILELPYDLAPGLYTMNATVAGERFTRRLVVE